MHPQFSQARDMDQSICVQQEPSGAQRDSEFKAILQQLERILLATKILKQKKGSQREGKKIK
jgi:hypothetical protein